jgi:hypothetical protein
VARALDEATCPRDNFPIDTLAVDALLGDAARYFSRCDVANGANEVSSDKKQPLQEMTMTMGVMWSAERGVTLQLPAVGRHSAEPTGECVTGVALAVLYTLIAVMIRSRRLTPGSPDSPTRSSPTRASHWTWCTGTSTTLSSKLRYCCARSLAVRRSSDARI